MVTIYDITQGCSKVHWFTAAEAKTAAAIRQCEAIVETLCCAMSEHITTFSAMIRLMFS